MGTINSDGIFIYDDTESLSPLSSYMNLQGSALSTRLAQDVRFKKVTNEAARTAYVNEVGIANISAANPLAVYRQNAPEGLRFEVTYNGTTWDPIPSKSYFDSLDTGWVSVSLASGYAGTASVRRIGNQAYVRWTCTTSIAANDAALPLLTVPVGYRPSHDVAAAVSGLSLYPWTCDVRTNGQVRVRNNHTTAQANMTGSASYIAA